MQVEFVSSFKIPLQFQPLFSQPNWTRTRRTRPDLRRSSNSRLLILRPRSAMHTNVHQSVPLPLSQTFSQYFQLGSHIKKHYVSPRVFLCLVTGRFVPPIHRKSLYSLQYSMLPAKRVPVGQLWSMLMEGSSVANGHVVANGHIINGGLNGRGLDGSKKAVDRNGTRKGMWWSK